MIEAIRHSSRARWRRSEAGSGGRTRELPGSHSKAFDSVLGPLTLERAYVTPGVKDGEATTSSMKTIGGDDSEEIRTVIVGEDKVSATVSPGMNQFAKL